MYGMNSWKKKSSNRHSPLMSLKYPRRPVSASGMAITMGVAVPSLMAWSAMRNTSPNWTHPV